MKYEEGKRAFMLAAALVVWAGETPGRDAHIPAGKSTCGFSYKPLPVLWRVNILERMNDAPGQLRVFTVRTVELRK